MLLTATAQPVTEKQDQASTQFWLDLQLSKSQALLHPDLKAVNSSFEALKSAHGAPDRVQGQSKAAQCTRIAAALTLQCVAQLAKLSSPSTKLENKLEAEGCSTPKHELPTNIGISLCYF